ncbi:hypothetical protein [Falsochrobactrum shanghaiense]|nr:hypothetical protein [Falsochrobactrum shanghaiense]
MRSIVLVAVCATALSGCVQTQEMALAKNVYQLEVSGSGLIAASQVPGSIQKRAAELTISKGYSHFLMGNANLRSGSEFAGYMPGQSNTTINTFGNSAYANTTYSPGFAMRRRTANASVTVVMFNAKSAPSNALDAAQVLASLKKK